MKYQLAVNFPIHNEAISISIILDEWIEKLEDLNINYCLVLSEDGSKDNTKEILREKASKNKRLIDNLTDDRRGYGGAVLSGVTLADAEYILCVDSDGQCDPEDFKKFWNNRNLLDLSDNKVLFGYRDPRVDSFVRKIYSFCFRVLHFVLFPNRVKDPSCPYVFIKKTSFNILKDLLVFTKEGFWWGFIAACIKRKFEIIELSVNHRNRKSGKTQVYHINKIPGIALRNAIGLVKIKFLK
jgi:dolichol-phosphate mannosyltransferase